MSSLTAQAKQFPLKKPSGFHWDFFLLGWTTIIAAVIGIPFPNGLVPQAPVHTDALCNYRETVQVIRTEGEDAVNLRKKITVPESVVEQRVSHFLMGLAIIGTMTGPLLVVLGTMPRAIFSGVFFVVGVSSVTPHVSTRLDTKITLQYSGAPSKVIRSSTRSYSSAPRTVLSIVMTPCTSCQNVESHSSSSGNF